MNSLSLAQVHRLNDSAVKLHSGILTEGFESVVNDALDTLVPTEIALLGLIDARTGKVSGTMSPCVADPHQAAATFNRLSHQHPAVGRRTKNAQSISQHLSRQQWHRRDLFAEMFRPYGVEDDLGLEVDLGDHVFLFVGRLRARRNFTEEDRVLLTLMIPHLRAAWQQSRALQRMGLPRAMEHELEPGVVELDERNRAVAQGAMCARLFRTYFGTEAVGGELPAALRGWVPMQRSASLRKPYRIANAEGRLTIRLTSTNEAGRIFLSLHEERWVPDASHSEKLGQLGISRREQEVLFWVAQGKTNLEVARLLAISGGTVKRHLENIYAALGVENRHAASIRALRCMDGLKDQPAA